MKMVSNNCHGSLSKDKSKHKLSMNQYFQLLFTSSKLYRSTAAYRTPKYLTGAVIIQGTKYFAKRSGTEYRQTKNNDMRAIAYDNRRGVQVSLTYGTKNKKTAKQANVSFYTICL